MKKKIAAVVAATLVMSTASVMAAPVTDLVNKAKFDGNLRFRYETSETSPSASENWVDKNRWRLQLNVGYDFNEQVAFKARLVHGEFYFDQIDEQGGLIWDQYYLTAKPDKTTSYKLGRQEYKVFNGAYAKMTDSGYDKSLVKRYPHLVGGVIDTKMGDTNVQLAFGNQDGTKDTGVGYSDEVSAIVVKQRVGDFDLGAGSYRYKRDDTAGKRIDSASVYAGTKIDKVDVGVEYGWNDKDDENKAYIVVLGAPIEKWKSSLEYRNYERNASSPFSSNYDGTYEFEQLTFAMGKDLSKNVGIKFEYEYKDKKTGTVGNTFRADTTVKF